MNEGKGEVECCCSMDRMCDERIMMGCYWS